MPEKSIKPVISSGFKRLNEYELKEIEREIEIEREKERESEREREIQINVFYSYLGWDRTRDTNSPCIQY